MSQEQEDSKEPIKIQKETAKTSKHISILDDQYLPRMMAAGGYVMLGITTILLLILAFKYFQMGDNIPQMPKGESKVSFIIQHYTMELFILSGALISMSLALKLLFGASPRQIIPDKDRELLEPLIKEANKEAINQYAILSGLSGFTGVFQKIGFSGLPLATVMLTLIFSFLSFFNQNFMELAKLTLGAFIGSFVQKGQNNR